MAEVLTHDADDGADLNRRTRLAVMVSLLGLTGLAWVWLAVMLSEMAAGAGFSRFGPGMELFDQIGLDPASGLGAIICAAGLPAAGGWGWPEISMVGLMWLVMLPAMMLPTAVPMVATFAAINANKLTGAALTRRVGLFVGGYLLVWVGFGLAATLLQWGLTEAALLTPGMVSASPWLSGGVLLTAGLYQVTPIKDFCLTKCRNPMPYFFQNWKNGASGALKMGLHHGAYCLGCCWALMVLMFVAGAMNLIWIAVLGLFMLAEKAAPRGDRLGKVGGGLLALWGAGLLVSAAFN